MENTHKEFYIITGQGLAHGCPVYFTEEKKWTKQPPSPDLKKIALFPNKETVENTLKTLTSQKEKVIDPYFIPVLCKGGKVIPVHIKEKIRMRGPTVPLVTSAS